MHLHNFQNPVVSLKINPMCINHHKTINSRQEQATCKVNHILSDIVSSNALVEITVMDMKFRHTFVASFAMLSVFLLYC
jgi:hypothetical protein